MRLAVVVGVDWTLHPWRLIWGVTAGQARYNSSNVRGVTAGQGDTTLIIIIVLTCASIRSSSDSVDSVSQ